MQTQQKPNTILAATTLVTPTLSPAAEIINYLRSKCNLPLDQIQSKLMNGETFDVIKGQGNDIDTKLMEELLNQNDFYQKPSQKNLKDQAMRFIKGVVEGWSVAIAKNQMRINQDQIHNYTAKLLPFGSYVLDLRSNSSDIDLICVCPNFIQRETHFFGDLTAKLQSQPQVKSLATRANARVPIITFFYKQIQIDISFCQLDLETIPKDIEKVISSELVASIKDEQSRTSLLGRKNNLMILQLTGKQMENFKQTLRVVKVWAKNRGISSNVMGYLGGISWAILVAKVCQLFPNHKPAKLLSQFFTVFSIWNWNQVPVRIMPAPSTEEKQKQALMCVVTPGSDYNSTERVNSITYKQLYEQIRRANQIMSAKRDFNEVCRKVDFFNLYELYMEIDICGSNKNKDDGKQYKDFLGLVESRVLKLLQNLARHLKKQIEDGTFRVIPNPKIYKKNDQSYEFCNSIFFGFEIAPTASINICKGVKEWCISIDQARPSNKLNVRVFEGKKQDFTDVEINEVKKKKQEKQDPRLARRRKAAQTA